MWRRSLAFGLSILAGSSLAQTSAKPFLIGAEWQEGASQAVKDLFWETGCNFARITGGGFGWAVDAHKRALKELDQHGVRVLLQLGSHYPDARYFDFKDAYFIDQNGKTGVPSRQSWAVEYDGQTWPQYSYASSKFRSELEKDFAAYFKALGPQKNIEALLLHNEPGYAWLDNSVFDYNPEAIARFRKWLPDHYSSISDLNHRWNAEFASFAEVDPPKDTPPTKHLAAWMDWRRFNADLIADFLTWERQFAKQIQPTLPDSTNLPGPLDNWYPIRLGDNYRFSRGMDIVSIDIYPGSEWTSSFFPGYAMDMTRGIAQGKPIYVAECESYSEKRFPKLSDQERADRLSSDLWSYIGHGANGISIWTLNGQDEFRLTNGEYNSRIGAVRETAYTAKMLNLGDFSKPARQVALVVDQDSYLLDVDGEKARDWASKVDKMAVGIYSALARAHVEVDIISAEMVRNGIGDRYKALVLAALESVDSSLANRLSKYVEAGGLLISDASLATFDHWGGKLEKRPGLGLDRIFGVQLQDGRADGNRELEVGGTTFHGLDPLKLTLQGAQTLPALADNKPSVTQHSFGKGHTIMVATNSDSANSVGLPSGVYQWIGNWLKTYAGIQPQTEIGGSTKYLDTMRLIDGKQSVLTIITNPPDKADAAKKVERIRQLLTTGSQADQSFLFLPTERFNGRTISGPKRILGKSPLVLSVTSYSAVLTTRDHLPLIATDSPASIAAGSKTPIKATVFNPSSHPLVGTIAMVLPKGWEGSNTFAVKIPPYGQTTVSLIPVCKSPTKRAVLKVVMTSNKIVTTSIPVDIEVR